MTRIQAIEREIAPVLARHRSDIFLNEALFRAHRRALSHGATASASTPSRRGCSTAITSSSCAPARGSTGREGSASPRSPSGSRRSARSSARTCSPTKRTTRSSSKARTISPACRTSLVAAAARAAADRGPAGQARHHAVALLHRALPAILEPARPAREGLRGLDRARRQWRRDRQSAPSSPRWSRLRAERAQLLGYETFAALPARRHDGEDAGSRARPSRSGLGAGPRARAMRGARRAAGDGAGGGRQLQRRALGLALLRRESAARRVTTSTRPRSSRICSSTG